MLHLTIIFLLLKYPASLVGGGWSGWVSQNWLFFLWNPDYKYVEHFQKWHPIAQTQEKLKMWLLCEPSNLAWILYEPSSTPKFFFGEKCFISVMAECKTEPNKNCWYLLCSSGINQNKLLGWNVHSMAKTSTAVVFVLSM